MDRREVEEFYNKLFCYPKFYECANIPKVLLTDGLVQTFTVPTFQAKIVICIRGCKSIYRPLFYPLRSLVSFIE